jgi:hypothetical protein
MLGKLTEVEQGDATRFDHGSISTSRLDRLYTSIPPWALLNSDVSAVTVIHPRQAHDRQLSDHSPVIMSIAQRKPLQPEMRPIARSIFKHEMYKPIHDRLCDELELDTIPTFERWEVHKEVIREAARLAKEAMFLEAGGSTEAVNMRLTSIARAVTRNDAKLANILITHAAVAREHIEVSNGSVLLKDPLRFRQEVEDSKSKEIDASRAELDREYDDMSDASTAPSTAYVRRRRKASQSAALMRRAKLWNPFDRRMVLAGVHTPSTPFRHGKIMRDPRERARALADGWFPTFCRKDPMPAGAQDFAARWTSSFDFSRCAPPSKSAFRRFLSKVRHSAPGPDGIPYEGWKRSGERGVQTLFDLSVVISSGLTPPYGFNQNVNVFIPKGECAGDDVEVTREVAETRPVGMKNKDNTIIGGVWNESAKPALAASANRIQRGFIPGRQMIG